MIGLSDLEKILTDTIDTDILRGATTNYAGQISVYMLPGDNYVIPSLQAPNHECPLQMVHVRNLICPLGHCKQKKSKLHTLLKKETPLCLHTIICHAAEAIKPYAQKMK